MMNKLDPIQLEIEPQPICGVGHMQLSLSDHHMICLWTHCPMFYVASPGEKYLSCTDCGGQLFMHAIEFNFPIFPSYKKQGKWTPQ